MLDKYAVLLSRGSARLKGGSHGVGGCGAPVACGERGALIECPWLGGSRSGAMRRRS